jgi:hypothetical protein
MEPIKGRKKSDVRVVFGDETEALLQLKHGKGNGRGWSADRRSVSGFSVGQTLLANVCLKRGTERPEVERSETLISDLLLGKEYVPTHFVHVIFADDEVQTLKIGTADAVMAAFNAIA